MAAGAAWPSGGASIAASKFAMASSAAAKSLAFICASAAAASWARAAFQAGSATSAMRPISDAIVGRNSATSIGGGGGAGGNVVVRRRGGLGDALLVILAVGFHLGVVDQNDDLGEPGLLQRLDEPLRHAGRCLVDPELYQLRVVVQIDESGAPARVLCIGELLGEVLLDRLSLLDLIEHEQCHVRLGALRERAVHRLLLGLLQQALHDRLLHAGVDLRHLRILSKPPRAAWCCNRLVSRAAAMCGRGTLSSRRSRSRAPTGPATAAGPIRRLRRVRQAALCASLSLAAPDRSRPTQATHDPVARSAAGSTGSAHPRRRRRHGTAARGSRTCCCRADGASGRSRAGAAKP